MFKNKFGKLSLATIALASAISANILPDPRPVVPLEDALEIIITNEEWQCYNVFGFLYSVTATPCKDGGRADYPGTGETEDTNTDGGYPTGICVKPEDSASNDDYYEKENTNSEVYEIDCDRHITLGTSTTDIDSLKNVQVFNVLDENAGGDNGCGDCGGGNGAQGWTGIQMPEVLVRSSGGNFLNMGAPKNFAFTKVQRAKVYQDANGNLQMDYFNAHLNNAAVRFFQVGNDLIDTTYGSMRHGRMYTSTGTQTTDLTTASNLKLTTRNGRIFEFELFSVDAGILEARLVKITAPNKQSSSFNFLHTKAELAVSGFDPDKMFILANHVDANKRQTTYSYDTLKRQGSYCVSSVTSHSGNTASLEYDDAGTGDLKAIAHPGGHRSTCGISQHSPELERVDCVNLSDRSIYRKQKIYFKKPITAIADATSADGIKIYNSACGLARCMTDSSDKVCGLVTIKQDQGYVRRCYDKGKIKHVNTWYSAQFCKTPTLNPAKIPTGGYNYLGGTFETTYAKKTHWGRNKATPSWSRDDHNQHYDYKYTKDRQLTKVIYRDQPGQPFRLYKYDADNNMTYKRNRAGEVTVMEYGSFNNITKRQVGIINGTGASSGQVNTSIAGLNTKVYTGSWDLLPDFAILNAAEETTLSNVELHGDYSTNFGLVQTGNIQIQTGGDYTFTLGSDDGSRLYIDGQLVVDNDGLHGYLEKSGTINLLAGSHTIRVEFFEKGGAEYLRLYWNGADSNNLKQFIPDSAFSHIVTATESVDYQSDDYAEYNYEYYPIGHQNECLLKKTIDPEGNWKEYLYNTEDLLTEVRTRNDEGAPDDEGRDYIVAQSFEYLNGQIEKSFDAVNRMTTFARDSWGRVTLITYHDGSTEKIDYGTGIFANCVVKKTDRNGIESTKDYVGAGDLRLNNSVAAANTPVPMLGAFNFCGMPFNQLGKTTSAGDVNFSGFDFRGRPTTSVSIPNTTTELWNIKTYVDNKLFCTEDAYGRKSYYLYRAGDSAMTRVVNGRVPSFSLADFAAVAALTRDLSVNADYTITDMILDDEGRNVGSINARGIESQTVLDSRGRTKSYTAALGTVDETTSYTTYFKNSLTKTSTNGRGFTTSYTYTKRNLRETVTIPEVDDADSQTGRATATATTSYYKDGRIKTQSDFMGNTTTSIWHQCCGRFQAAINALGHGSISNNDFYGNVTHTANVKSIPVSGVYTYHDPIDADTLTEVTTRFDGRHRPIARTVWLVPQGNIDPNNVPIATDPTQGLTTTYQYFDSATNADVTGHVAAVLAKLAVNPFGTNADGSATIVTNPEGEVAVSIADGVGRTLISAIVDPDNNNVITWSTSEYDNITTDGKLVETRGSDAYGNTVKSRTDGSGLTRESLDADGNISYAEYDANGNMIKSRSALGVGLDCVYDSLDRKSSCTDTAQATSSWTYDLNGNVLTYTDPNQQGASTQKLITCTYDERDRKETQTTRVAVLPRIFRYDHNNNLDYVIDEEGNSTNYEHDVLNRQVAVSYQGHNPSSTYSDSDYDKTTCTFDELSRKSICTNQKGEVTKYKYDLANRLETRTYFDSLGSAIESVDDFEYDNASRLVKADKGRYSNSIGFDYDKAGRLSLYKQTVNGTLRTIGQTYDNASRPDIATITATGNLISKTQQFWTNRSQLDKVLATTITNDIKETSFLYDLDGRENSRKFANNLVQTREYRDGTNVSGKVDNVYHKISMTGVDAVNFTYNYDANKNVEGESRSTNYASKGWTAAYDKADRLSNWNKGNGAYIQDWELSAVGNLTNQTISGTQATASDVDRTFNGTHELKTVGTDALNYDNKGNRLKDADRTLVWDNDNHLKQAETATGAFVAKYEYDALGRRVAKVLADTTRVDFLLNANDQVCSEFVTAANTSVEVCERSYCTGSYIDDQVLMVTATDSYSLHRDRQFNTRAVTNSAAAVVETYEYTPQGTVDIYDANGLSITTSSIGNMNTFTGRYFDQETGLHYFRARYFDSKLNTFISRDPLGYIDGYSLSAGYFANDMSLDPSGLYTFCAGATQAFQDRVNAAVAELDALIARLSAQGAAVTNGTATAANDSVSVAANAEIASATQGITNAEASIAGAIKPTKKQGKPGSIPRGKDQNAKYKTAIAAYNLQQKTDKAARQKFKREIKKQQDILKTRPRIIKRKNDVLSGLRTIRRRLGAEGVDTSWIFCASNVPSCRHPAEGGIPVPTRVNLPDSANFDITTRDGTDMTLTFLRVFLHENAHGALYFEDVGGNDPIIPGDNVDFINNVYQNIPNAPDRVRGVY